MPTDNAGSTDTPALRMLDAHYQAMPPVAALQLRIAGYDGERLRLQEAGLEAPVYVADSNVRFRVPLFADLEAEAWLQEGDWDSACTELRSRGRTSLMVASRVGPGDGSAAAVGSARYVAMVG